MDTENTTESSAAVAPTTAQPVAGNNAPLSPEQQPAESNGGNNGNEKPRKSRKGLITAIIIIVLALIGGGIYFVHSALQGDEEAAAYEILENNDNPQDYEDYLTRFPEGEHAEEVRQRLDALKAMIEKWNTIALSDNADDFRKFKEAYTDVKYTHLCDIKIDSLDWLTAQRIGTQEAYQHYLDLHADGRYASEASIAQGQIRDSEVNNSDRDQVMRVVTDFFHGFEQRDESMITSNITSTMTTFLHSHNATKAEVLNAINGMFNEHIESCTFEVNRDINVQRTDQSDPNSGFTVTFTVDQHITRDNEGKTFGSYNCTATLTPQYLISSLTMTETSANR